MRQCRFFVIRGIETLAVVAAIYFEPTYVVRGTLWGEAFFEGRPTSYWRGELNQWALVPTDKVDRTGAMRTYAVYTRQLTFFECVQMRRWPFASDQGMVTGPGPSVLHGDDEAIPVLHALLDDVSSEIRRSARFGLDLEPELSRFNYSW